MIRTFFRHLFESIKSLKRNGWMTVASTSAVTITLVLVGVFLGVIMNTTKLATDIENNVNVNVFVDIGTTSEEMDQLKSDLKDLPNVEKVTFSSKDEELDKIQETMGSAFKLFEGDSNPLYDVYIVSTTSPSQTKKVAGKISEMPHVFKADYGGKNSDKIFKIAGNIKTWGLGGTILLLFVAMFLISNTIRITILSRQREIQIMRLVGAKNGFIRWPFFLEGAWIGLIGSIIPVLVLIFGYRQVYLLANPALLTSNLSLLPPAQFVPMVGTALVVIGVVIGSLGSIISMRRFLKV
ncbi:MAG: permease-like cell division protein FtsX [Lactobacillales bacterium]|jgi:cell division transport system permease protein|nr:permease-like cell division protein FtsX [Lactobacillales bacterium]